MVSISVDDVVAHSLSIAPSHQVGVLVEKVGRKTADDLARPLSSIPPAKIDEYASMIVRKRWLQDS